MSIEGMPLSKAAKMWIAWDRECRKCLKPEEDALVIDHAKAAKTNRRRFKALRRQEIDKRDTPKELAVQGLKDLYRLWSLGRSSPVMGAASLWFLPTGFEKMSKDFIDWRVHQRLADLQVLVDGVAAMGLGSLDAYFKSLAQAGK